MDTSVSRIEWILAAAEKWAAARHAVVEASIYPIGNAEYRERLSRLADAEENLRRAIEGQRE